MTFGQLIFIPDYFFFFMVKRPYARYKAANPKIRLTNVLNDPNTESTKLTPERAW